jgi:ligand-binding SRPBCC domain-containing protein
MIHELRTEQWIDRPLDEVFLFFSEAANLERITPPELRFEILNQGPVEIEQGTLIDYRLRLAGLPFNWRTEITAWDPPHSFEDTQLKGPYSLWIHTHSFETVNDGTRITDHVRYRLPLSPLGDLAYPLIRFQLRRIFGFRHRAVEAYFSG